MPGEELYCVRAVVFNGYLINKKVTVEHRVTPIPMEYGLYANRDAVCSTGKHLNCKNGKKSIAAQSYLKFGSKIEYIYM